MGILFITYIVCTVLLIISCSESDKNKFDTRVAISFAALSLMFIVTVIIATTNKDFITPIIDNYENGKIIKIENVIIEDTDTIKVVEYKYK